MSPRHLVSHVSAAVRITLYLAWTAALLPLQALAVRAGSVWAERIPRFYHRGCARIIGLRIVVKGEQLTTAPTLFIGNHLSYADITVLGGVIRGSFVAKAEVRQWPLFGILARLQRSIFVDRRPGEARRQFAEIKSRLESGARLIMFAEGTSSDGNRVLPYKTPLFAAVTPETAVQPFSIAVTRLDGMPIGRWLRPLYAWYGDMELLPHLWSLFGIGRLTIVVTFHPPVRSAAFASRKALAEHCRQATAMGLERANLGIDEAGEPCWAA